MKNRVIDRIRHSDPQLQFLPTERLGRSKRVFSLEVSTSISEDTINHLRNNQLLEAINRIE